MLLLAATVLLLLLFIPDLRRPDDRLLAAAEDLLHFPLFLAVAILVLRSRMDPVLSRGSVARVAGGLILAAAAVEVIQPFLGRTGQWTDAVLGGCGVLAGVAMDGAIRAGWTAGGMVRVGVAFVCGLVAVAAPCGVMLDRSRARRDFPQLASFESALELGRWKVAGCRAHRVRSSATHGKYALGIRVSTLDEYPGLFLTDLQGSWAGMARLCVHIHVPSTNTLVFWMRADDRANPSYEDRYQQSFELSPGSNRICVALADFRTPAGRTLDLTRLKTWGLFLDGALPGTRFDLDDVVLERL